MKDAALTKAIDAMGGPACLARHLGITSQAISQWTQCPVERAREISALTEIPLHELRPDIWEAPEAAV